MKSAVQTAFRGSLASLFFVSVFFVFALAGAAHAQVENEPGPEIPDELVPVDDDVEQMPNPTKLDCRLALVQASGETLEHLFAMPLIGGGTHGGTNHTATLGSAQVIVQGDIRWLNMRWEQGGKLIGQAVTVRGLPTIESLRNDGRVVLLFHPQNESEQLHLTCEAK